MIREAQASDEDAVWAVLEPIFRAGDTYTIDSDISREAALAYWRAHHCYVAERDGQVLGTYYLRRNQGGGGAHVCNCGYATHPEARGRGVASAMLNHSLDQARHHGFRAMQYNFVVATNEGAIRLWRGAGFEEVGRLPGAFQHPEKGYVDALVMFKRL